MRSRFLFLFALAACSASEHADQSHPPTPSDSAGTKVVVDSGRIASAATPTPAANAPPATTPTVPASAVRRIDSTNAVVRALYVNRYHAQSRKSMQRLIAIADETEINALVIDMKDEFGLNYDTKNPEFKKNAGRAGVVRDLTALLDTLKAHKILAVARIVVFKDSVTARVHPEWTIRRTDSSTWRDKKGIAWVNPYHRELWDYNIGVAEELVKLGFQEIQFDYIRFPEPYKSLPQQVFPGSAGLSKPEALAQYLKTAKARMNALGVRSTADIFGLVTTVHGPLEVGQWWEKVSPQVDVVLPMVYPSHFAPGTYRLGSPNAHPYETIDRALRDAKSRSTGIQGAARVVPWYQDFTMGPPHYNAPQVRAQIQAGYDNGIRSWMLWNSRSDFTLDALRESIQPESTETRRASADTLHR